MENVSYMYNELDVIGAIGKSIYVRTKIPVFEMETPDFGFQVGEEWVCLVFTMTSWMELQKEWIKNKKKICEMYGHFCGWSDIQSDVEYVGEINMRIEEQLPDGKWNDRYEMVRALKPKNFQVCMEHG